MAELPRDPSHEALRQEIAGEQAAALGRCAARMEAAIAELRAFDGRGGAAAREALLAEAAERLWFYVIQREVMGWYDHAAAIALYAIPDEVVARMGPKPRGR